MASRKEQGDYILDYKTKSLKLMKQLAETELTLRRNQDHLNQSRQ